LAVSSLAAAAARAERLDRCLRAFHRIRNGLVRQTFSAKFKRQPHLVIGQLGAMVVLADDVASIVDRHSA
jgi:hypothetical protein